MLGVGIIAMDRPHYLVRLVASLEQQKNAGHVEYHLFQDGINNVFSNRKVADDAGWQRVYRLFDSCKLEPKWIHCNTENWGIALHQSQAPILSTPAYQTYDTALVSPPLTIPDRILNIPRYIVKRHRILIK